MGGTEIKFLQSIYLLLLFLPSTLFLMWLYRFFRRRSRIKEYLTRRDIPVNERYFIFGQMFLWLCLIGVITFSVFALARPQKLISIIDFGSVDLVIIQDGSASMKVADISPDRWQRSMMWIKTLVETLGWRGDRVGLALFAHRAAPQIRLTSDPNVLLFFLDHLKKESPFGLEEDTTWDTNMEEGVYWAAKLIEKDKNFYGPSKNPFGFVIISDGQIWSGKMEVMFKILKQMAVPVYVIGAGTTVGGIIPDPGKRMRDSYNYYGNPGKKLVVSEEPPVHSSIDRYSLRKIAETSGGKYFELNIESDAAIASKIINDLQKRRFSKTKREILKELYWYFLAVAAVFCGIGIYQLSKY